MKVAILYICTGRYNQFFSGFYQSCEQYLMKDEAELEYFVFTDDMNLSTAPNVHLLMKECAGFPADSLFRFEMFMQVKEQLKKFDFILFLNSNAAVLAPVSAKEVLPMDGEKLVAATWPKKRKWLNNPGFFPYERNKQSLAYIPPFQKPPYLYFMGGINGGETDAYMEMIETLARNIRHDYDRGIVACVHDESHINKYLRSHSCKILSKEYCCPEEWIGPDITPKIIFRDKVKLDPYFNKGRDHSLIGKLRKTVKKFNHMIKWYI